MAKKRSTSGAKRAPNSNHASPSGAAKSGTDKRRAAGSAGPRGAETGPSAQAGKAGAGARDSKSGTGAQAGKSGTGARAGKSGTGARAGKSGTGARAVQAGGSGKAGVSAQKARALSRKMRQRRQNALIAGAIAAVVTGLIAYQVIRVANLPGQRFADQGNVHLVNVDDPHPPYNSDPPTSGWHMPNLAPWGVHDSVVADEHLVHNLEDGGVVIYYPLGTPEANQAAIDAIRAVAAPYRNVVIAPREGLTNAYVFTAWRRMQRFDTINEAAMGRFLKAYEGIDHHVPGVG